MSIFRKVPNQEISAFRNLRAFAITETELKLMAKAAIMGDNSSPKNGYSTPAAMGTPSVLYTSAKNRFCLIFPITFTLRFLAFTIPCKSPFTNVMEALSIATSVLFPWQSQPRSLPRPVRRLYHRLPPPLFCPVPVSFPLHSACPEEASQL